MVRALCADFGTKPGRRRGRPTSSATRPSRFARGRAASIAATGMHLGRPLRRPNESKTSNKSYEN